MISVLCAILVFLMRQKTKAPSQSANCGLNKVNTLRAIVVMHLFLLQFTDLSSAVALSSQETDKSGSASTSASASPAPQLAATPPASAPTAVMLVTSQPGSSATTLTMRPSTNGMVGHACFSSIFCSTHI